MIIKVYTSQTCGQCKMVKRFLEFKKAEYEEVDLTHDYEGAIELQQRSNLAGFPITEIDGKFILGYNPKRLTESLLVHQATPII